jgi:hypothetical protein
MILGVPLVKIFNLIAKVAALQCTPHLWIAEIERINMSHLSHGPAFISYIDIQATIKQSCRIEH